MRTDVEALAPVVHPADEAVVQPHLRLAPPGAVPHGVGHQLADTQDGIIGPGVGQAAAPRERAGAAQQRDPTLVEPGT